MTVEEIKRTRNIISVARELGFTTTKYDFIRCPCHNERTASCKLYPESNTFHCFGCHTHGDIFDLVMSVLNCGFLDAFKYLGGTSQKMGKRDVLAQKMISNQHRRQKEIKKQELEEQKDTISNYINALHDCRDSGLYEPFSAEWTFILDELEMSLYRLSRIMEELQRC